MSCYRETPSSYNKLKIFTIYNRLYIEFVSTYYNDKGKAFRYTFGQYIKLHMKDIDHPALIQE